MAQDIEGAEGQGKGRTSSRPDRGVYGGQARILVMG